MYFLPSVISVLHVPLCISSEDVRVRRQLHRARNELCLLRGTFQGLIAGSGVPWNAADTHLLEVTLNLGDDEQWK